MISIPLIFGLVFVFALTVILHNSAQDLERMQRSRVALSQIRDNELIITQVLLTILTSLPKPADEARALFEMDLEQVQKCESGLRLKRAEQPYLRGVSESSLSLMQKAQDILKKSNTVFCDESITKGQRIGYIRDDIFDLFIKMGKLGKSTIAVEQKIQLQAPAEIKQIQQRLSLALCAGIIISLLISIGLAIYFSRDFVSRLRYIGNNANCLGNGATLMPLLPQTDEISNLDKVLHESYEVLEQSRRRERAILDNAADVLCSLDKQLGIVAVGASCGKVWLQKPEELMGRTISGLLAPDCQELFARRLGTLSSVNQIEAIEFESAILRPNGTRLEMLWSINWIEKDQSFYCVARDVTAQKAVEAMKQRLIAIVSHDLRTPISSVFNTVSLLLSGKRGDLSPQAIKELKRSEQNLDRLMDLLKDLLELEKLESGKIVLTASCVSAYDICAAAIEAVLNFAGRQEVTLVPPHGDLALLGDERRLVQVLVNLLSNAIKFSPVGSQVSLTISDLDECAEIAVCDQGPGIAKEDCELIFQRFAQSSSKNTSSIKGTGLGLAIVKSIVEAHGGCVGVTSQPGAGSKFFVQLPKFVSKHEGGAEQ